MEQHSAIFYNLTMRLFNVLGASAEKSAGTRSIFISSARTGEGKTFMANKLATYMAGMSNERILLVDANMERPGLHSHMGVANGIGFSDYLMDGDREKLELRATQHPNLFLLPAGQQCRPGLLFKPEPIQSFIEKMASEFSVVVFDGCSIGASGCMLHLTGGTILVVDTMKTRREVIQGVMSSVNADRSKYHGVILNKKVHYIPKSFYRYF